MLRPKVAHSIVGDLNSIPKLEALRCYEEAEGAFGGIG